MDKTVLVVGATTNPSRYAYRAAHMLHSHGYPIALLGKKKGKVLGMEIEENTDFLPEIDTITMYVGAHNQTDLIDPLLALEPRRIIFNPGAENPEFEKRAREKGIIVEEACTLIMLSSGQF